VYLETSIISYLVARPSRDIVTAAHQQITLEWWTLHRKEFDLFVSELVIREAEAGDPDAAQRRMEVLAGIRSLVLTEDARSLAHALIAGGALPEKAAADALHVAVATVQGAEYLLTWNCQHIANARVRVRIDRVCRERGLAPPVLCTPEELMGDME